MNKIIKFEIFISVFSNFWERIIPAAKRAHGAAEFAIRSYVKSYFGKKSKIKIGVARAGNVIGGGDWSDDRLLPDCVKSWSSAYPPADILPELSIRIRSPTAVPL